VLAIAFYVVFKKDKLITPMVTGYKDLSEELDDLPAHRTARKGGWVAFAIALASALAAVYLASGAALPQEPPAVQAVASSQTAAPGW